MSEVRDGSVQDLLSLHAGIMDELRRRGVARSANNPTGELAEFLFCGAFSWQQADNSEKGFDARDGNGNRYQIKGRHLYRRNKSRQLSAIRGLEGFDMLAAVLFDDQYRVARAALIPREVVHERAKFVRHTNSHRFMLTDDVWKDARVKDVTEDLKAAESRVEDNMGAGGAGETVASAPSAITKPLTKAARNSSASTKTKGRKLERAAYRLFYDNIHDFKTTAMRVESELIRHGIRSDSDDPVPGMKGRIHRDMWVSMKTVAHFNLATALELMLKLLLFLNNVSLEGIPKGRRHLLTRLHDEIPKKYQTLLESVFQASRSVVPNGWELIAFINTATPVLRAGSEPPNRDISCLRGLFEYLDEDALLWQKRYSWELVDKGRWRHYLSDISVFVELINRVMRDIERH